MPKKIKEEKPTVKSTVKLISYSIKAVIPTGMYANIQPEIIVSAGSISEAESVVLPYIDNLFEKYQEDSRDGKMAKFLAKTPIKSSVTSTEIPPKISPVTGTQQVVNPVSEAFAKAKKAIDSAMSIEAIQLIEEQIHKSTKLTADEKPVLLTQILLKRKELDDAKTSTS
jgi:alcohol dehydrogenase class IV